MDKKETISTDGKGNVATIHEWSPVDESGRHKNTVEIENDIEETRHSMDLILDALGGKTNPGALYDRFQNYFQNATNRENIKSTISNVSKSISNSFQRNPLPVMMVATGASWMLWETQRQGHEPSHDGKTGEQLKAETSEQMQRAKGETGERAEYVKGKAGEISETAKSKAAEMTSGAKERTESFLSQVQHRGEEYRGKTAEMQNRAKYSYRKADTAVHSNPLLFGVAAAFAGIVAGLMIPETKVEDRYAGEKAGEVFHKAKETGKEITKEATQKASNKAKEEGISPEQLSQKAQATLKETGETTSNKFKEEAVSEQQTVSKKPEPKAFTPGDIGTRSTDNTNPNVNKSDKNV